MISEYFCERLVYYDAEGLPHLLPEHSLPLNLPEVEKYLPTETGEPPLGNATHWAWDTEKEKVVSNDLIDRQTVFPLELNTMPGWAGSSQYFNRYMDPANKTALVSQDTIRYWQEVDLYIGGSEHATGHLLYSRFWQKFMSDRGWVPNDEYASKLINQGMILGTSAIVYRKSGTNQYISKGLLGDAAVEEIRVDVNLVDGSDQLDLDGLRAWQPQFETADFVLEDGKYIVGREVEKMSKRWFNVVNPDTGVHGFLKKLWKLYHQGPGQSFEVSEGKREAENLKTLHKTIKKVTEDIEDFSFNTSISTFMICVNELTSRRCRDREILEPLAVLISPYAPHIAEELWEKLGHDTSIAYASFPVFEEKFLVESTKEYPISFNGKMRFTMELPLNLSKEEIETAVLQNEKTQSQLKGRSPRKVIVVPGKIVNIVA